MTTGFIDMTALTSALGAVKQGFGSSLSDAHDRNLVEVTYFLLHDEMRVIPHPGNIDAEVGDVATFFSVLPVVTTTISPTKQAVAARLSKEFLETHKHELGAVWERATRNQALWNWAVPQRDLRWLEHSQTYGALFDESSISYMAPLLEQSEHDLRNIYTKSTDPIEVGKWLKERGEEAAIAIKAWVLGWLIRGKYYAELATQAGMHLFPHPLREGLDGGMSGQTTSQRINRSEELFIRMVIGSALVESSPTRRVAALAENIGRGQRAIQGKTISLPPTVTETQAERFAAQAAKDAGIPGRAKIYRNLMRYGVDGASHAALGFSLSPWMPIESIVAVNIAAHCVYELVRGRDIGEDAASLAFDTKARFEWLSKLPAGKIEHYIGSFQN